MKPTELPEGWIVETSKSLPNRIYYFNTKTNKSSWEFPVDETQNFGSSKPSAKGRKRKTEDAASEERPVTPIDEIPKKTKADERRKLTAKRTVLPNENKRESAQNSNVSNKKDTPQMKLLREKMLQRQAKGNAVKKSKTNCAVPTEKEAVNAPVEKATKNPDIMEKAQSLTPQMAVILEKMKKRQSKGTSSKAPSRKSMIATPKSIPQRRPRTKSMGFTESIAKPSETTLRRSSRSIINNSAVELDSKVLQPAASIAPEIDKKAKEKDLLSTEMTKEPRLGRSARKNLARERLEKLQKSFTEERSEVDSSTSSNKPETLDRADILRHDDSMESLEISESSLPSVHKNADARATFLRERLKNKMLFERKINNLISDASRGVDVEEESTKIIQVDSFDEEMEWEPIEDDKIMQEIQVVRSHIGSIRDSGSGMEIPHNSLDLPDGPSQKKRKPSLYIVIDTNVFLSNLIAVEEARDTIFKNYGHPLIVIPWTVIRELDFIKDDKSMSRPECLRAKARQAVRFLHQHFSARHPRILGQTPLDVANNKKKFDCECPDDEILQTCLQIRTSDNNVVLLSYDKNLCNKAMIHDLVTLGRHDPLEKIDYLHASEAKNESFLTLHLRGEERDVVPICVKELRKTKEIMDSAKEVVTSFMTVIVAREMQNLYNDTWEKYTFMRPPWNINGVLSCALKHWIAAVSDSFDRRAEPLLKEILKAINTVPDSEWKLNDVGHILEIINDLLQCVKAEKYPNLVAQSMRVIADLRGKCAETSRQLYEEKLQDTWGIKNDTKDEDAKAQRAFQQFEDVYAFARDMCGLASDAIGMPCSFSFKKLEPIPTLDDVKEMQPEVAANLNRLIQILGIALEEVRGLQIEHRAVEALYHALSTFMPERKGQLSREFSPLDVYWCLKKKDKVLRLGLTQLQELNNHFCRMASFRCT